MTTPPREQTRTQRGASLLTAAALLSLAITSIAVTAGQSGDAATTSPSTH